ncbi:MAG TPA: hypothetical protein PK765_01480 [bacterium]|nr:hypothetical protein [bacterium]
MRFAVPAGATLVDATAPVSTDTYPTLTTLSTTIETKPGESGEFRMRYRVPARSGACSDPTLLLQPGLRVR